MCMGIKYLSVLFHLFMSWKLREMEGVSRDCIQPLMWVKALMYPWDCSTKSWEFFKFSEWCPQIEELLIQSGLHQDGFTSLNGHSFMNGTYVYHICTTILMLGIVTLRLVRLCEPSMLLLGCEVAILSSPPAFLLLALWVWFESPVLGLLWARVEGVFSAMWMALLSLLAA
jgi:hypothetical protein